MRTAANWTAGSSRCSRHCINSTPTAPVAPTTATTGADEEGRPDCMLRLPKYHDQAFKTPKTRLQKRQRPRWITGGAARIRYRLTRDQRANSSRAPQQGFLRPFFSRTGVRVFVVSNISLTLPYAGRQVKVGLERAPRNSGEYVDLRSEIPRQSLCRDVTNVITPRQRLNWLGTAASS